MGEIADDMTDGSCCQLCGQYFEHPKKIRGQSIGIYVHEYPAVCFSCWDGLTPKERKGFTKAEVKTFMS